MPTREELTQRLPHCLIGTDLPIGRKITGHIRDRYDLGDTLILVSTDRHQTSHHGVTSVPCKGQVMNQINAWWFRQTSHIIANHVIDVPDPNVIVAKNCLVYPIEFVVSEHLTGSTQESVWMRYSAGERTICDHVLPDGMQRNQRLDAPIIIPMLDVPLSETPTARYPDDIIALGIMSEEEWNYVTGKALELFDFGQKVARNHGLILAFTTYTFGVAGDGTIMLVDELHTPNSSHYWIERTYHERFSEGEEPDSFDLGHPPRSRQTRAGHREDIFPIECSARYIDLYEMITGERFRLTILEQSINDRISMNLSAQTFPDSLHHLTTISPSSAESETYEDNEDSFDRPIRGKEDEPFCVVIAGSVSDADHVRKITAALSTEGIHWESHVASAHREASDLLELLDMYTDFPVIYITVAGQSNALSGFVAGNTDAITIACPPYTDRLDLLTNIHSTIQMPQDVPAMTILEPQNVALAVRRIIDLTQ